MSDRSDVAGSRALVRRHLVALVRRCNDVEDQSWDARSLAPGVMQVWALTGGQGDARQILERIELATIQDEHFEGADGHTYRAVMRDLLRLRDLLGLEQ